MGTLHEMTAAIDRVLPLCEAVSRDPSNRDTRQALSLALAVIADESFLEPCTHAKPGTRGLCNFVHIQAILMRDCMTRSDEPADLINFIIGSKARDLLALLPELKKSLDDSGA
jgi:hypothetical protein